MLISNSFRSVRCLRSSHVNPYCTNEIINHVIRRVRENETVPKRQNNVMDSAEFCSVLSATVVLLSTLAVPEVFLRGNLYSLAPPVSILGMHRLVSLST